MRLKKTSRIALWLAALFVSSPAWWPTDMAFGAANTSWNVDAEAGYVGGAAMHGGGGDIQSVDEYRVDLRGTVSSQISKNALLRFGVECQQWWFGVPKAAPLPADLRQINALIGLDYQISDRWLLRADVQPGIYSASKEASWCDVDAPLGLGAAYLANADLQWFVGVRIDVRSEYPALPAAGVRWKFADAWTLNLIVPNPRLEYDLSEKFKTYLGAGIDLGTFRVSDHFGDEHGQPAMNHALLDYFEARVGLGISWKVRPNVAIEADAGLMVYRAFAFSSPQLVFRSEPAPYAQVACRIQF